MDNYEDGKCALGEVTLDQNLNKTSEDGDCKPGTQGLLIPRPMKVKERPKSVSNCKRHTKSMQNSKVSIEKLVWAQSSSKFDNSIATSKQKFEQRYKGFTFG